MNNSVPKLIVIVGETASGKSALAMDIAKRFNGEIINADSWQVYKGFDIGTAKPTPAERLAVPHHLFDIVEPTDDFSAAVYKQLATKAISEVSGRGHLPILVGGTGLYIDGVIFDYSFLPVGSPGLRERLAKFTIKELLALIDQQGIDITGTDTSNKRRLIRLIETGGARPGRSKLRPQTLLIGIRLPRTELRKRVESRTRGMLKQGLKAEARQLAAKYGWDNEAMKGIGYRQVQDYLAAQLSNSQLEHRIVKATMDLAKRQRTWFKRHPQIAWVKSTAQGLAQVKTFLGK